MKKKYKKIAGAILTVGLSLATQTQGVSILDETNRQFDDANQLKTRGEVMQGNKTPSQQQYSENGLDGPGLGIPTSPVNPIARDAQSPTSHAALTRAGLDSEAAVNQVSPGYYPLVTVQGEPQLPADRKKFFPSEITCPSTISIMSCQIVPAVEANSTNRINIGFEKNGSKYKISPISKFDINQNYKYEIVLEVKDKSRSLYFVTLGGRTYVFQWPAYFSSYPATYSITLQSVDPISPGIQRTKIKVNSVNAVNLSELSGFFKVVDTKIAYGQALLPLTTGKDSTGKNVSVMGGVKPPAVF